MKLYHYEHCPFCIRARMILGLRNLSAEEIVLANDDETTPTQLIGKKMVPILVKDDGSAIGESLDIVRYLDSLSSSTPLDEHIRTELQQWLERVNTYAIHLIIPRDTKIGFDEFATDSAIAYFTRKKSEMIGDFTENLARSDEYIQRLNQDLEQLTPLILSPDAANGNDPSMEDIHLFPLLRNLTMVRGIAWPERISNYLTHMSKKSNIDLLFDRAI